MMNRKADDMKLFKNLTLIGSSHISIHSVREVNKVFKENPPYIVAVELDKVRFHHLLKEKEGTKQKMGFYTFKRIGFSGFVFAVLGSWISKKLGKIVNMKPGSEMMRAITLAKEKGKKIALIDQDIEITLKRFSRFLTFKEKIRIAGDIFRGLLFPKQEIKKYGIEHLDLTKVPPEGLIEKIIDKVKERYPNIYRVLIHERNVYMARQIHKILLSYPDKAVVAVVGAGHKNGILKILKQKLSRQSEIIYSYSFSV